MIQLLLLNVAAPIGLLLVLLESLFPASRRALPLGGSHAAQIGILFGSVIASYDLVAAVLSLFGVGLN